ncbi:hypothetical protein CY34DRAFT_397289 [Suillus luteus UH-Slu-Lm8-n1]|uniref:Uncharacterized protein n=1 Tax=Suillus luteus UH-Slu-Lm8-n1 TaxID=930992 RepID=A0A0D0AVD6_9AGAM|nr:hypothetical protein CY34DRAFT_397289 [Suillus luteus UH-Slu-Lm8-n1]
MTSDSAVEITSTKKPHHVSHSFRHRNLTPNTYDKLVLRTYENQSKAGTNNHPNALTSFPFVPKHLSVSYSQFTLLAIQSRNPYRFVLSFITAHM